MDRTAFADCAVLLATLGLAAGCGAKSDPPPQAAAPRVLAELQAVSPGAWRHDNNAPPVVMPEPTYAEPAELFTARPVAPVATPQPNVESAPSIAPVYPHDTQTPSRIAATPPATIGPLTTRLAQQLPPARTPIRAASRNEAGRPRRKLIEYRAPREPEPSITPEVPQTPDERGTLPWAYAKQRSPEMDTALKAAQAHVRSGFRLAERHALYLARAEFIAALELVAEANDVQQNTSFYSDALNAGLLALAESSDFAQRRPVGKRLDVARIVSGHKTPILKRPRHNLAPTLAAKRYHDYAREQLAAASGMQSDASMAMLGLGKVAIALGTANPAERLESTAKAATLYEAALMADTGNYRAANELGVIQARRGKLVEARDLLAHSASLAPHPATQRNLAAVYTKLGQPRLAEQATGQAVALEKAGYRRGGPAIEWLEPAAFASTAPASGALLPPASTPTTLPGAETPPVSEEKAAATAKRGLTDWLPWNVRR